VTEVPENKRTKIVQMTEAGRSYWKQSSSSQDVEDKLSLEISLFFPYNQECYEENSCPSCGHPNSGCMMGNDIRVKNEKASDR